MQILKKLTLLLLTINLSLLNSSLYAQIATDGTLGLKTNLPGPQFQITPDLGQQRGGNLFHSFEVFNLKANESATFSGPASVENILARVTGSQRSLIDGILCSKIPNANLYLLNPNGILFGKNASLDISGSFHASTADYLRFGDGGSFYARPDSNPALLSVARPEAFGFLSNRSAAIEIQGSVLRVSEGNDLSMTGGDLTIKNGFLHAPNGTINITANRDLQISQSSWDPLYTPQIDYGDGKPVPVANVDVSGQGGGKIFIRAAGHFILDKSRIFADNYGDEQGQGFGIDIHIEGDMSLTNGARITTDNHATNGHGGSLSIMAGTLQFSGKNEEDTECSNHNCLSMIKTNNSGNGPKSTGGEIRITTTSFLKISPGLIQSATATDGAAGNTTITADQLLLEKEGFIYANTIGNGQGGTIQITANKVSLDGTAGTTISAETGSEISTKTESTGNAGNIVIVTKELNLANKGAIDSRSDEEGKEKEGDAGSIEITAVNSSFRNGSYLSTEAFQARGGNIKFHVSNQLLLFNNSQIIAEAKGPEGTDAAGNLTIDGFKLFVFDKSLLLANAKGGHAGIISIRGRHFIPSYPYEPKKGKEVSYEIPENVTGIYAFSEKGESGEIWIDASREDITRLSRLREDFPKLNLSLNRCSLSFSKENQSRFIITARDILPRCPEDLRTHGIRLGR